MIIHGREIELRRTVGAEAEIADLCPDGDIRNLTDFLFRQTVQSRKLRNTAKFISALSRAGESAKHYEDRNYEPNPMTTEEILALSTTEFMELQTLALEVFTNDANTTVKTEAPKKEKPAAE